MQDVTSHIVQDSVSWQETSVTKDNIPLNDNTPVLGLNEGFY